MAEKQATPGDGVYNPHYESQFPWEPDDCWQMRRELLAALSNADTHHERLEARIHTLEAGIEREAVWCEEIADMDLDPDEAADFNRKRAARLRALLP